MTIDNRINKLVKVAEASQQSIEFGKKSLEEMNVTTTPAKLIKLLGQLANEYNFDLIVEPWVSEEYITRTYILFQHNDDFTTIFKALITLHKSGCFEIEFSSNYEILSDYCPELGFICPTDSDELNKILKVVQEALETYRRNMLKTL